MADEELTDDEQIDENTQDLIVDDLALLPFLDESSLNETLATRYSQKRIYTYIAGVLVSVNPFEHVNIYGYDTASKYRQVIIRCDDIR